MRTHALLNSMKKDANNNKTGLKQRKKKELKLKLIMIKKSVRQNGQLNYLSFSIEQFVQIIIFILFFSYFTYV